MKLSYNWLKNYVDVDIPPEELADKLTMIGLEVEGTEKIGNDTVFEIEITFNHHDCLGIIGIAREVSVLLDSEILVNVPYDVNVSRACVEGNPVVLRNPKSPVTKAFRKLASRLIGEEYKVPEDGGFLNKLRKISLLGKKK